jgi:transcriptional regulator with PAS, ATPase and Fis domain
VTLLGETGTGKGVLARAIHMASERRDGPFVVFDCGAVAPTLIESQLFGHEKGAFTGAVAQHQGAFERAHAGTLFIDEIGELALELQPKLLRVIEEGRLMPLGGSAEQSVDVRIVAATNRDLEEEVSRGTFRQDLFFRLSGTVVHIPPLRKRLDDIPAIIEAFADRIREGLTVTPPAIKVLQSYDWPGNVRELRHVIASAAALTTGTTLFPQDLVFFRRHRRQSSLAGFPLAGRTLDTIEAAAIRQTLDACGGNRARAAEALGIAVSTLYQKIKKYSL